MGYYKSCQKRCYAISCEERVRSGSRQNYSLSFPDEMRHNEVISTSHYFLIPLFSTSLFSPPHLSSPHPSLLHISLLLIPLSSTSLFSSPPHLSSPLSSFLHISPFFSLLSPPHLFSATRSCLFAPQHPQKHFIIHGCLVVCGGWR